MAVFPFLPQLALDADGDLAPAGAGQIYAEADATFTTPLAVTDAAGAPMATVAVTALGVTEYFQTTDHGTVWWKSGTMPAVALVSHKGYADAAEAAQVAAEAAEASATALAALVEATVDDEVAGFVADTGSATRAAVDAVIAAAEPPAAAVPAALGRLFAGLALRNAGPCVIVAAGDSTVAGGSVSPVSARWVNRFAANLHAAFPLDGGDTHPAVVSLAGAVSTPPAGAGIHVVNAGVGSTYASDYLTEITGPQVADLGPAAVLHMVGANDFYYDVAVTTYKAALEARLTQIDTDAPGEPPVHVLVHCHEIFPADVLSGTAHTWAEYGSAMSAIADARTNVVYVDLTPFYEAVDVPGADPLGLISPDDVHQTNAGHAFTADLVAHALALPGPRMVDDTGWVDVILGTGWLTTANYAPQVRRIGNRVILKGALTRSGTSGNINSMFTLPAAGFFPGQSVFVGAVVTNGGAVLQVTISPSTGLGFVGTGYTAGTAIASGAVVPLNGEWLTD